VNTQRHATSRPVIGGRAAEAGAGAAVTPSAAPAPGNPAWACPCGRRFEKQFGLNVHQRTCPSSP
jgi:hypothetical protein